jgi:ferredoxin-NADP reductase
MSMRTPVEMEVERVTVEVADTKTLRLRWPDGYDVAFKTGQFITIYWADAPDYKRAYSLSSSALDRGHFEITVKRDGKMGTRLVDWIKAGDRLLVLPPVGRFLPVFDPGKEMICMAGGSGVTPFRGFAREATRRNLKTPMVVLYSVRTPEEIIFNDEFRALALENPHFRFEVTCTRLEPEDPWVGRRGRLSLEWLKEHVRDASETVFYACGSNAFVHTAENLVLNHLHLTKDHMRSEKWG